MEVVRQNSRSSISFSELDDKYPLPHPDVTEPSFRFHLHVFNAVKDDAGNVVRTRLLVNYNLICSRCDFPRSIQHSYLRTCLADAGLSQEEIQDLWLEIQSTAKSIAWGRDAQLVITVKLSIGMNISLQDELEELAEADRQLEEDLAAAMLENEELMEEDDDESDPDTIEDDDDESDPEEYLESSGDNKQVLMAVEASMQERVVKTVPASKESIEVLRNIAPCDDESVDCCVTCVAELGSVVTAMPCGHYFHRDCVLQWLNTDHVCPLCRFELPIRSID